MVKRYKPPSSVSGSRSLAASENSVGGGGGGSRRGDVYKDKDEDQIYCVVLHVVEAINFCGRDVENEQIVMNAALNTVDFEIEGQPSATSETIVFNSNCIWECDMAGIKRIKTDHRPVKVTFYSCGSQPERKTIGTLVLPVRGLPVISSMGNQTALLLKMFWHKLICISNEFRSHKPEVLLMLAIVKKSLLHTKDFEHLMQFDTKSPASSPLQSPGHSITANMLHSQANVYVQSLVQLGLLQVGNDPLIDCDIIEVVLQLKQLKNICKLVKSLNHGKNVGTILLVFDFVGNVTNIELKLNEKDSYVLNDVLGLRFKSSLRSMRLYFQRIFYLPINMYINGTAVANYRMDFGKLMPVDSYFDTNRKYVHNGSFTFNRLGRADSARELKPLIEYTFSVDIKSICSRQSQQGQYEDDLQPSISSASSVIRELPQEHQDQKPETKSWQHQDDSSAASLNVGAELSASENDENDDVYLPLDANNNGEEPPKDFRPIQGRRKKFTRLKVKADSQESEEDLCLVKKFSSMVVRQPLMPVGEEYSELITSASEEDVMALYNNKDFNKDSGESRKEKTALKSGESNAKLERQKTTMSEDKSELNKEMIKEQKSKTINPVKKVKSDKCQLHSAKADLKNEKEMSKESNKVQKINSELLRRNAPKESLQDDFQMRGKSNKLKNIQPITENFETFNELENEVDMHEQIKKVKLKPKPNLMTSQSEVLRNARKLEEINAADLQELPQMESILARKERMRKRQETMCQKSNKITERDEEEPTAESENSFAYIPSRCTRRHGREDEYGKRTESSMDFFKREVISELKSKKDEEQSHLPIDTSDPNLDESVHLSVGSKESKRKLKPQPLANEDHCKVPQTAKEMRRMPRAPQSEMALSARWVEVNRHQEKIIKENENYIEQIYKTNELIEKKRIKRTKVRPTNGNECNTEDSLASDRVKRTKSRQAILDEEQDQNRSCSHESSEEHNILKVIGSQSTLTNFLSTSAEVDETELFENKATKRIVRKKIVRKSEIEIEDQNNSIEISESLTDSPNKKKLSRKNSRTDQESFRGDQPKKIIKKKSSGLVVCDSSDTVDIDIWKKQQMALFEKQLQFKIDQLQLEELQGEPQSQSDPNYESKFMELEKHVVTLKQEMEEQVDFFRKRNQEITEENTRLRAEKAQLEEHVSRMEHEIQQLSQRRNVVEVGQDMKQVLNELAKQNKRIIDLAKEKDRFKRQWRRSAKKMHALKLSMFEKNLDYNQGQNNSESLGMINLKSILTKDAVEFEREYGQFRHSRPIPSFQISTESDEFASLASRETMLTESSQR
ncbi:trichohyalin [Drosophila willistoni]|uniref:trichohyalin n=1 Tax=Drosophila willistoni TaxID=7260 RepID=UPI000C26C92A|nr:trichohyalin [Drosophila willistoni]